MARERRPNHDGEVARPLGRRQDSPTGEALFDGDPMFDPVSDGDRPFEEVDGKPAADRFEPPSFGAPGGESPGIAYAGEESANFPRRRLDIFVRGQPITQGNLKMMRGRIVQSNDLELMQWRSYVTNDARVAWGVDQKQLDGPLRIDLDFYVTSNRTRTPRMRDPATGLFWLATKGIKDIDKLERAVLDALTASRVYADDGLIVEVHKRAFFASPPDTPQGAHIVLYELG